MTHLLLAITITIATGFNRPTWIDIDPKSGDIWFVNRGDNALVQIHNDGSASAIHQLTANYAGGPTVPFNFGGPFGGGIAIEPAVAGCGGGQYAQGFFVSNSGAQQVVMGAFNRGRPVLANRDTLVLLGNVESPSAIALSWGYQGNFGSFSRDSIFVAAPLSLSAFVRGLSAAESRDCVWLLRCAARPR